MKAKKVLKILAITAAAVIVVFLAGAYAMFRTQLKAAGTIEKVEEGFYSMEYEGDYGFDEFLEQGGAATDDKLAAYIISFLSHGFYKPETVNLEIGDYGCCTLSVKNKEGGVIFGRNYDWETCDAMVVHTKPENGYESISTCCLDFLGFGEEWKPEGMGNQFMALASVYLPLDGMNEKGLCIADLMAGDKVETHQDTDKPDVTITSAIRLLLDKAATVDEAVALLEQYDMNSSIGSAHHFSITDATGKSVVIEYVDNEMYVTDAKVVTNHYLSQNEKNGVGSDNSKLRYQILCDACQKSDGIMSRDQVAQCLKSVSAGQYGSGEKSQWSIVWDIEEKAVDYYWNEDYDTKYEYSLLR